MEKIKNEMLALGTMINLIIVDCFGRMTMLFYIVFCLMGLDLITRIYAAGVREDEKIESRKILKGLYQKIGLCLLLLLSLILDLGLSEMTALLGLQLTGKILFTNVTLAWIFVRELISNVENLQSAGIELPGFIMKALSKTKEQVETVGEAWVEGKKTQTK